MLGAAGSSPQPETPLKRKRNETEELSLDRRPFTIHTIEPDLAPQSLRLEPYALLPRVQVPFAYLDTSSSGPRTFSACLSVLEDTSSRQHEDTILVAFEHTKQRLYAIERVGQGRYALCALGERVGFADVQTCSTRQVVSSQPPPKRRTLQLPKDTTQPWWAATCATVPATLLRSVPIATTIRPASLDPQPQFPKVFPNDLPNSAGVVQISDPDRLTQQACSGSPEDATDQSPPDALQELAKHYLETLYLSRTSLAYFSKGPLSRTRAAATSDQYNITPVNLCIFLREAILTALVMDKKYKFGLTDVIRATLANDSPQNSKRRKKKRRWKAKRDKEGFFVDEKDYVEQWWSDFDDAGPTGLAQTADEALQRRLPELRQRETFLQITLVLEVLALEATLPEQSGRCQDAELKSTSIEKHRPNLNKANLTGTQKLKLKRKTDLLSLLETLVDRLCIWHSLDSSSPAKHKILESADQSTVEVGSDSLKNFCVEVIIPFYMPRIPQAATIVNKKLGGPSAPTPIKLKSSTASKPGAPAVRHAPAQERRLTFPTSMTSRADSFDERLSQTTQFGTTSDVLSNIKRETSEISLASIPPAMPSKAAPRKRASLMHSMSFSKREVDLSAISQASEAKMRKKADIQAKMQEAISNIKKPNRALATRDIADSTDESFARATAKQRPGDLRRSKAVQQSVQVTATPKHVRASKATPYRQPLSINHSSGPSHVCSSTSKPHVRAGNELASAILSTGHRARHDSARVAFAETPSRGFSKYIPPGLVHIPGTLDTSPIATRRANLRTIQQTPSRPIRALELLPQPLSRSANLSSLAEGGRAELAATPIRPSYSAAETPNMAPINTSPNSTCAVVQSRMLPKSETEEESIYASLGWDEENFEQLT